MNKVRIRPLADYRELSACVDLQKKTWGPRFNDVVSAALMLISQKIGGVAAGAFDEDGNLIGIVFGLSGIRGDVLVHWSHMLAVVPEHQGKGLGRLMKIYQRERVLKLGIHTVYWTFDPLEARNAHFNFNVLRVHLDEYVIDMYGSGESSPLHRGLGTDRFVVRWDVDAAGSVLTREQDRIRWEDGEAVADIPAGADADFSSDRQHGPEPLDVESESRALIEIPPNIQGLKAADATKAGDWRTATRAAFTHHLSEGRTVVGFGRHPGTGACFYVLDQR